MSGIIDLLIVGIVLVGGYYVLTSGMLTSLTQPQPALGPAPALTPVAAGPTSDSDTPLTDEKYGLAPNDECKARGSDHKDVKCKCQKEGPVTFGLCDMPEGLKCTVNIISTKATEKNIKDIGLEGCEMNGRRSEIELALGGSPAKTTEDVVKEREGEAEDEDEDEESKFVRSFYSSQSPYPAFTMRRSDGLGIAEARGYGYYYRGGLFS